MTNEEKAREIRCYLTTAMMADGKTKGLNLLSERNKRCADLFNINKLVEMAALQALELKDKEWADRFKKAFVGLWTARFNVDNLSSEAKTTIEFELVTRE